MSSAKPLPNGMLFDTDRCEIVNPDFDLEACGGVIQTLDTFKSNLLPSNQYIPNTFNINATASIGVGNIQDTQQQQQMQYIPPSASSNGHYVPMNHQQQQQQHPNIYPPIQQNQYFSDQRPAVIHDMLPYGLQNMDKAKMEVNQVLTDSVNAVAMVSGKPKMESNEFIDLDKLIDQFMAEKETQKRTGMEIDVANAPIPLEINADAIKDFSHLLREDATEEEKEAVKKQRETSLKILENQLDERKNQIRQVRLNLQQRLNELLPAFQSAIEAKTGRALGSDDIKSLANFVSNIPLTISKEDQNTFTVLLEAQASRSKNQADQINTLLSGLNQYRNAYKQNIQKLDDVSKQNKEIMENMKMLQDENEQLKKRMLPYGTAPEHRFQSIPAAASVGGGMERSAKRSVTVNSRAVTRNTQDSLANKYPFNYEGLSDEAIAGLVASRKKAPMEDEFIHQNRAIISDGMFRLVANESWEGKTTGQIPFFKKLIAEDAESRKILAMRGPLY